MKTHSGLPKEKPIATLGNYRNDGCHDEKRWAAALNVAISNFKRPSAILLSQRNTIPALCALKAFYSFSTPLIPLSFVGLAVKSLIKIPISFKVYNNTI